MKHTDYALIDADSRGTTYLLDCLATGHTLARATATSIAGRAGRVKACVPLGATMEQAHDFRWAISGSTAASCLALATLLASTAGPDTIVVAESPIEKPDDPGISEWPAKTFRVGDELYAYLSGSHSSASLLELLRMVDSPHECTVVLARPILSFPTAAGPALSPVLPVDPAEVQSLAPLAQLVSVRAYDGEGYVLWLSDSMTV